MRVEIRFERSDEGGESPGFFPHETVTSMMDADNIKTLDLNFHRRLRCPPRRSLPSPMSSDGSVSLPKSLDGTLHLHITCGADRDRTDDLLVANEALSQLSYSPDEFETFVTFLENRRSVRRAAKKDPRS